MKRAPDNLSDPGYVQYVCEACGYKLPHPAILRSIPRCPRCTALGPPQVPVIEGETE